MAGNANEWIKDWYSDTYYKGSPTVDPRGPTSGTFRVFRGGAWGNPPKALRSSWRYSGTPNARRDFIGFRCAMDQTPATR
jgi:formylglycine-generating enzyme required for sulfatase activity